MKKYGLTGNELHEIIAIFKKYPDIESAVLLGSRAIALFPGGRCQY